MMQQRAASCSPDSPAKSGQDNGDGKRASLAYLSADGPVGRDDSCPSPDPMMETSRAMRKLSEAFGLFLE